VLTFGGIGCQSKADGLGVGVTCSDDDVACEFYRKLAEAVGTGTTSTTALSVWIVGSEGWVSRITGSVGTVLALVPGSG
jgi:hypothetical protein